MSEKGMSKKLVFICVLIFAVVFCPYASAAQEEAAGSDGASIVIKETSMQDALKKTLEDNKRLKKEKDTLQREMNDSTTQINVYSARVNNLTAQVGIFKKKIEGAEKTFAVEKNKMLKEVKRLTNKNRMLESKNVALKKDVDGNEYYRFCQQARGLLKEAEEKIRELDQREKALSIENGALHYNLGNTLFKDGEYKKAAYEYEMALRLLPTDPDIYYNLAVIYDNYLSDVKKAKFYYKKYLQEKPDGDESLWVKERIIEKGLEEKMLDEDKERKKNRKQ